MNNETEASSYIEKNYPHIGSIKSVKKIKHNDINSRNFLASINSGKYVLRYCIGCDPTKLENLCKILRFCIDNNMRVMEPIKNRNDRFVNRTSNFFLTRYYTGTFFDGSKEALMDLAKELALLHKFLKNVPFTYEGKTIKNFNKILTISELKYIEENISHKPRRDWHDNQVLSNMNLLLEYVNEYRKKSKLLKSIRQSKQLIHMDLIPSNVIFKHKKVKAIIDFAGMKKGWKIDEVSGSSFRFAIFKSDDKVQIQKLMKQFIKTYRKYNTLERTNSSYFELFLKKRVLMKTSYILRKRYYDASDEWTIDLSKNLYFLRILKNLDYYKIMN